MVRMSTVWDRTVEVIGGRAGVLAVIALLTVALPSIVQSVIAGVSPVGPSMARSLISLIGFLLTVWGTLAMTAVASDPAVGEAEALRLGGRALPRALVVMLVLAIVLVLLWLPSLYFLFQSGIDVGAAQRGDMVAAMANAKLGPAVLYACVASLVMLWGFARLLPLYPVLANEGRMVGAIPRAFALTRGLTLRIVAVLLLFAIVVSVSVFATQFVLGSILGILFRGEQAWLALVISGAIVSVVATGFTVVQTVFAAQLYRAIVPVEVPEAPVVRTGPWA
jgi:hypothetical protein